MVCFLEHLTNTKKRTRKVSPSGGRTAVAVNNKTVPAASSSSASAPAATVVKGGDDDDDVPLPSLAERLCDLEDHNRDLREEVARLRERSIGALIPADTMDLALFVAVTVLIVYVGRIASRI